MNDLEFREMNDTERAIIDRLLEIPFPGSEDVAEQLQQALIRRIDDNGILDFLIKTDAKANVQNSVPVEAEGEDLDGTTIHVLLHVIGDSNYSRDAKTPSPRHHSSTPEHDNRRASTRITNSPPGKLLTGFASIGLTNSSRARGSFRKSTFIFDYSAKPRR